MIAGPTPEQRRGKETLAVTTGSSTVGGVAPVMGVIVRKKSFRLCTASSRKLAAAPRNPHDSSSRNRDLHSRRLNRRSEFAHSLLAEPVATHHCPGASGPAPENPDPRTAADTDIDNPRGSFTST